MLWVLFFCLADAQAQQKPNVVLMLSDNLGYGDLGAYGSGGDMRGMPTPNLDQFASEGLMLTQFFVEPGCTPSRAGLMTGRYSVRSGLNSIIVAGTPLTLKDEEFTIAELFKKNGYTTGMTGKWHLVQAGARTLPEAEHLPEDGRLPGPLLPVRRYVRLADRPLRLHRPQLPRGQPPPEKRRSLQHPHGDS